MMKNIVLVLLVVCAVSVLAENSFENAGVRVVLKIYDDCSESNGFSSCLKKKAITLMDRLNRMEKFSIADGIVIKRAVQDQSDEFALTEEQLENTLPRSAETKDDALNSMLLDKITNFVSSRTLEITVPKFSINDLGVEEGRKGGGDEGGGGGGGGKKGGMKGMMGGLMMGIAAKMAAMIPVAIAGLFLLAGKALITAKIALLISGIIAIKKLFAAKHGGGGGGGGHGGGHGGWQSSGHGGGWQSGGGGGGGGGWDKRSLEDPQLMAYKAYSPK